MGQMDRYFIGVLLTMSAVTFYTAPFDMVLKINLVPASITAVLFPAFTLTNRSGGKSGSLFSNSVLITIGIIFPIAFGLVLFAQEILSVWLGPEFVEKSTLVLQVLIIGAFVNSIANIPFTYLQGLGKPNVTAKVHLLEFLIYTPLLWLLISGFGILGAAFARTFRVFVDWFVLTLISKRNTTEKAFIPETISLIGVLVGAYYMTVYIPFIFLKIIGFLICMGIYFSILWKKYLNVENMALIRKKLLRWKDR